ncbi:NAD(P)H-dependent oxidoreductase [Aquimarina sp. ERC-38]|uniref:NAD(P)H-dependent oxidoreductase n=1 Tax=Aquimarina sp. ERC-38 TaxID=2949996 RepID=UPI002245BA77|nr:NAD(P)H-dependent oxidoreductase [Aquimarina sp. ERC-38]UZO79722.1 NAD(P)H-dependent oxidoreductase [Aquimarina sp. ERC-38]
MDFIENLQWRYATKNFDPKKVVSKEKIDILIQSFNLTATSYGLQPLQLIIVQNKEKKEALLPASYGQKQVVDASHILVICIERTIDSAYIERHFKLVKSIRNTSDDILNPFKQQLLTSFASKPKEEIQNWAKNQAYLALGNLLAACAVEQIDSCPMEGFIPERYDEILGLEKLDLQSVLALPIGYRAHDDMFAEFKKVRRSVEDTVVWM